MAPLGALSQAWTTAEASLPLGWRLSGLMRFGEEWLAFSKGPAPDQHIEASGRYAEQALLRLSEALRRRVGKRSGPECRRYQRRTIRAETTPGVSNG